MTRPGFYPTARTVWRSLLYALGYAEGHGDLQFEYDNERHAGQRVGELVRSTRYLAESDFRYYAVQGTIDLSTVLDAEDGSLYTAIVDGLRKQGVTREAIKSYGWLKVPHGIDAALLWSPAVPVRARFVHEFRTGKPNEQVYHFGDDELRDARDVPPHTSLSILLDMDLPKCGEYAASWVSGMPYRCGEPRDHVGRHVSRTLGGVEVSWPHTSTVISSPRSV